MTTAQPVKTGTSIGDAMTSLMTPLADIAKSYLETRATQERERQELKIAKEYAKANVPYQTQAQRDWEREQANRRTLLLESSFDGWPGILLGSVAAGLLLHLILKRK